jgi:site-specific DNA-cytosine methylase
MKIMLDLYSGLGGASEAMLLDDWVVIRIENNPLLSGVENTRMLDMLEWRDWLDDLLIEIHEKYGHPVTLIWASPPCTEFSQAYQAPAPTARREGREFEPDLSLMWAAYDIIMRVRPKYWVIENVAGAIPKFNDELGPYQQKIKSFVLWGRFPYIAVPVGWTHSKMEGDTWSSDPIRANRRAYVPMEISDGLLQAVCMQSQISDWA